MTDHRVDVTRDPVTGLLPFCPKCGSYVKCPKWCSAQGRYHIPPEDPGTLFDPAGGDQ